MGRRTFTKEFKAEALKRAEKSTVTGVARELGIAEATLTNWRSRARGKSERNASGDSSNVFEMQKEVRELRAENRRLQLERDILKKATAFFANENK